MSDQGEFLMRLIEENWTQARHTEDQRATITNLIVIIASITQGVLTQTHFTKSALPLTFLLILLGIYGAIASAKLYERHQYHVHRARKLRRRLSDLYPDAKIYELQNIADREHEARFPVLAKKIRLHNVWLGLHLLIAALGVVYTIVIFAS